MHIESIAKSIIKIVIDSYDYWPSDKKNGLLLKLKDNLSSIIVHAHFNVIDIEQHNCSQTSYR